MNYNSTILLAWDKSLLMAHIKLLDSKLQKQEYLCKKYFVCICNFNFSIREKEKDVFLI